MRFSEENRFMVALDECKIMLNPLVEMQKVNVWEDAFRTDIFEAMGELQNYFTMPRPSLHFRKQFFHIGGFQNFAHGHDFFH